jgi:hypothetical protein
MIVTSFIIGFFLFCFHALLVLVWLRVLSIEPVLIHILDSILIHVIGFIVAGQVYPGLPYWQGAALYVFLSLAYLYAFSAFYTSISLSILIKLWLAPNKQMDCDVIFEQFVRKSYVERVEMLIKSGQVEETAAGYQITSQGQKNVTMIRLIQRRLFGIENSGIYTL